MRETACEPKWRQWISEIRRYCNLGGDNFDVSAYYDLLAPLSAHIDVWETNYYHALPGYEAILDWYRGTGLRPYLAQLPDDGLYLRVLRASVERAIDFSYVRGLVSRPATCFDGGCRRQGARRCHVNGSHVKKGVAMVSTTLDFAEKYLLKTEVITVAVMPDDDDWCVMMMRTTHSAVIVLDDVCARMTHIPAQVRMMRIPGIPRFAFA